jgi:hypothetical protein
MVVFDMLRGKLGKTEFLEIFKWGLGSSIVSLLLSIPIDTFFWGIQWDIRYRTDPN